MFFGSFAFQGDAVPQLLVSSAKQATDNPTCHRLSDL